MDSLEFSRETELTGYIYVYINSYICIYLHTYIYISRERKVYYNDLAHVIMEAENLTTCRVQAEGPGKLVAEFQSESRGLRKRGGNGVSFFQKSGEMVL